MKQTMFDISELAISALYESSLNRLVYWMEHYDIATLTAFRNSLVNVQNPEKTLYKVGDEPIELGHQFTLKENRVRNKGLYALLRSKGYGVIRIAGSYVEAGQNNKSTEESFLVVNRNNDPNFKDNIMLFGEYYNQDSILYKKAGEVDAILIGTNGNQDIEYHDEVNVGSLRFLPGRIMSRIKNAAFSFAHKDTKVVDDADAMAAADSDKFGQILMRDYPSDFQRRKQQRINEWIEICQQEGIDFPVDNRSSVWALSERAKAITESLGFHLVK